MNLEKLVLVHENQDVYVRLWTLKIGKTGENKKKKREITRVLPRETLKNDV
jgi:hypothetical protein